MTTKFEDWKAKQMKDPEFKSAFEDLFDEHQIERLLVVFSDILNLECEEDGTYIIGDYRTTVYGDGETTLEALRDYIITLMDMIDLLIKSQPVGEKLAIKSFVERVCKRAEENMERTGKLEGSHYNVMLTELEKIKNGTFEL